MNYNEKPACLLHDGCQSHPKLAKRIRQMEMDATHRHTLKDDPDSSSNMLQPMKSYQLNLIEYRRWLRVRADAAVLPFIINQLGGIPAANQ